MNSRPEAGEEDARSDGSDVQNDYEAGEQLSRTSNDSLPGNDLITNGTGLEDTIPVLAEEDKSQQSSEPGSVDSLQALQTQNAINQLPRDSASPDETSSIPDDTPSIQVPSALLILQTDTHIASGFRSLFVSE